MPEFTDRLGGRLEPARSWFHSYTTEPRRYLTRGVRPDEHISLRNRLLLILYLLGRALWNSDLTVRAAATSYTFIFSIVPLLTTTLAFFTAFPGLQDQRENLQRALFDYL